MMWSGASLSNRIFLACTLLATLSLGLAFAYVNATATAEAEADLRRGLENAATLADRHRVTTLTDTFTRLARLVADLPKLKAAAGTDDPPTVQPLVEDYRMQMNADLVLVTNPAGRLLGAAGEPLSQMPALLHSADAMQEVTTFLPHERGLLQIVSVPIHLEAAVRELLGRLTVGFFLDRDRALRFAQLTSSEIAFAADGRVLASSLAEDAAPALRAAMSAREITPVTIGGDEYLALARPMIEGGRPAGGTGPRLIVLRSRTERLRFLTTLRAGLAGALLVAVLLATILSYFVARTITRPLAAVTGAMADVAATGDLTRRVAVRSRAWDDEDARLLAGAFNTLTESIERFRREEAQKERLSSLGRLSTVIAHEIRNPLMIIRASLRTLRREDTATADRREAVADIDEETARINRIVTEVLDFARPIRFELAEADVNEICAASASAAAEGGPDGWLTLQLGRGIPTMVTDAERLRTALVNVLTNARHAIAPVEAVAGSRALGATALATTLAPVTLRTSSAAGRVAIVVSDQGTGIAPDDLAHVFDPYYTTRRTGTGLGLPIARNIVEGLGGTLTLVSAPGTGTEIRIELPAAPPEARA